MCKKKIKKEANTALYCTALYTHSPDFVLLSYKDIKPLLF